MANCIIDQQKCEGHEKCDRLVISKMQINYQISQRNKILPNDPVLSNCVILTTIVHYKLFYKLKELQDHLIFDRCSKVEDF